jgi:hypothetical protein
LPITLLIDPYKSPVMPTSEEVEVKQSEMPDCPMKIFDCSQRDLVVQNISKFIDYFLKQKQIKIGHAMSKLCPKIILEGTHLTYKTDIAFALNEHARVVGSRKYRYHSPLISVEWCTFTNEPWGVG